MAQCFETRVEQYPNSVAVRTRDRALTYRELNQRANQIAHQIVSAIGTENVPVILLFQQGVDFLSAIFGALKAGKSYVPVDPDFPSDRNRYIIENSTASLVVTSTKSLDVVDELKSEQHQVLNIDELPDGTSQDNPNLSISPDAVAYIIYTSGSTGKPKGVFQSHRNLLHNAMNQINAFHLGVGDRMPLVHSCSVMGAVRVIYNALLSGTGLYPFDVKRQSIQELQKLLREEKITVFHSVATLFRHFSEIFTDTSLFSDLRLVILGGEAMYRKDVEFYKEKLPDTCLLATGLGSTEAGTIRILFLDKQTEVSMAQVPPGYAVDDVSVVLWDEAGREVPPGEFGEVTIESEYLALGYWQQEDRNAQTFAPVAENSRIRRFRTGDLGRFLPDGCLVHMGRKDFQVKIRGYRVDVAEVEMALNDTRLLEEVVVVGKMLTEQEMSLVAYVVPHEADRVSAPQLRHFVRQRLNNYMVPAAFVFLDALPQTPNGKLDRKALPTPQAEVHTLPKDFIEPRTPTEEKIAEIWQYLLKIERIGIHEDFFDLGGNSLLGAQFIAEFESELDCEISLALLAKHPTIAGIAEWLDQEDRETPSSQLITLQPHGQKAPLFLTYGVKGSILYLKSLARELDDDRPVYGLQAQGLDSQSPILESVEAIASANIEIIQSVFPKGPYYLGG